MRVQKEQKKSEKIQNNYEKILLITKNKKYN